MFKVALAVIVSMLFALQPVSAAGAGAGAGAGASAGKSQAAKKKQRAGARKPVVRKKAARSKGAARAARGKRQDLANVIAADNRQRMVRRVEMVRGKRKVTYRLVRRAGAATATAGALAYAPRSRGDAAGLGRTADALSLRSNVALVLDQNSSEVLFEKNANVALGTVIQFAATVAALLPLAIVLEGLDARLSTVSWTPEFIAAWLWSIFALSIGAIFLLFTLIRRSQATEVTSLLYLTPPTTAVMAWLLFGESLSLPALAGMAVAVLGVAFVVKK